MAPFLPVVALSRSQSIRIGRAPIAVTVPELSDSDVQGVNPQTGALAVPAYVDLGDSFSRRDLQHHAALGAVLVVGAASQTVTSDLFKVSGLADTLGSGMTVTIASGVVESRLYANQLNVAQQVITIATADATNPRVDRLVMDNTGTITVLTGTPAASPVAPATPANFMTVGTLTIPANTVDLLTGAAYTADAPTS